MIRTMGTFDGAARQLCQSAQEARSEQDLAQRRCEIIMLVAKTVRALGRS